MKPDKTAAIIVTIYLLVYTILHQVGASATLISVLFIFSPFLVGWMVYTILKKGAFKGKELTNDEEFGYQDKEKDSLGIF
ncbi:MAG: hypothetical protein ACOVQE_06810 [Chitinophagaceae bacterium]